MPQIRLPTGLNVHYERLGNGPDMVMIHGITGHMGVWHFKIVPMLWDHFHFLTYDLRGHGYTEMTETGYTPTELAGDLLELLNVLDIETVDLVGHSYGADIGLYFSYLYPERVRKALLIEPLVPALFSMPTRAEFESKEWLATTLDKMGVDIPEERRLDSDYMIRRAFETSNKWGPRKGMPRTKQHKDWIDKLFLNTSVLKDILDIGDLTTEEIPKIQVPIHLVYDSASVMWHRGYRFLRDNLPNVTSVVLPTGSGQIAHLSPLEKPEVIVEQIRLAFASELPAGV